MYYKILLILISYVNGLFKFWKYGMYYYMLDFLVSIFNIDILGFFGYI